MMLVLEGLDNEGTRSDATVATPSARVGFMTPWNQACGLATYASFLLEYLSRTTVAIFAEDQCDVVGVDEPHVSRCWARVSDHNVAPQYDRLEREIQSARIDVLHINCQARFFSQPTFAATLSRIRQRGVRVVIHLHQLFTTAPENRALIQSADRVIVHSEESKLEAIANGATHDMVVVLPHGVHVRHDLIAEPKELIRERLGLSTAEPLVSAFGFIQPHKGMEGVIEAVAHLRAKGISARGLIIGQVRSDDPRSGEYLAALQDLAVRYKLEQQISFVTRYVSDVEVGEYLAASDLVVMNYRSNYFEASGACSLAVGVGSVVMASLAPSLMSFGSGVWHLTGGYPIGMSAELLLTNKDLYYQVRANAVSYSAQHSWERIAEQVQLVYGSLLDAPIERPIVERSVDASLTLRGKRPSCRILMQNRPSAFTHRGGDTIVMERLSAGLKALGHDVTVDVSASADPSQFDIVHLFNFATPEFTEQLARRAHAAGVPFVVTTLYEDLPQFHNQSHGVASHLIEYVRRGQDKVWWETTPVDVMSIPCAPRFKVDWLVQNAAALMTNGSGENEAIARDFPKVSSLMTVPVGYELGCNAPASLFEREYGVRDFVLCVGRFETRKNQLMLLKALEHSELTVVLASGGFSYQPQYDAAVRSFKRKGRTIILDRVSEEMLSSAYAACRIHVLPSWYELPGLVSLEAAAHGKNIVVTRTGTSADYVGDRAFYCQPWDCDSMYAAVMAAFYAPVKEGLVEMAKSFTWNDSVKKTAETYEQVLGRHSTGATDSTQITPLGGCYDMSTEINDYESLVNQGEAAARDGDFELAESYLQRAELAEPRSTRVMKARAAIALAQGKTEVAKAIFSEALTRAPQDQDLLTGMGMCIDPTSRPEEAMSYFEQALTRQPDHLVALHQLLECVYRTGALPRAESAIRRFLSVQPHNTSIRFCLAGILYKQGMWAAAEAEVSRVLSECPNHPGACELSVALKHGRTPGVTSAQPVSESPSIEVSVIDGQMDEIEALKREGRYAEARELLEEVCSSTSLTAEQVERINCFDAEFLVIDDRLQDAEAVYDGILAAHPGCVRAICGKGALAAERQEWSVAQSYFERALSIKPNHDVGLAGLGLCEMVSRREEKAFELFMRAIASNPENRRALLGVLQLGYPMKKYSEIERALNSFLELHPANIEMLYSFAGILFAQGKVEEAKLEVEKILVFEPQNPLALELRDIIRGEKPGTTPVM